MLNKHTLVKLSTFIFSAIFFFVALSVFAADPDPVPLVQCGTAGGPDCDFNAFLSLIQRLMKFLIFISIPIATLLFSYAGFLYVTAGGNTGKIQKAHDIFKDVAVGFLIVLSAWLIVNTIVSPLISDNYETLLEPVR